MHHSSQSGEFGAHSGVPTDARIAFDNAGLRIGDAAVHARWNRPSDRERLLALLSVAAGRAVSADVLHHLDAAARFWERGDKALANLRLVFAGLPRLDDPTDAARVSLADYCLDQGMAPRALMKELGLDTAALDLVKYDSSQPRVPAGSGKESGRWASDSAGRAFVAAAPSLIAETAPEVLAAFARFAARFSVPTAILGALIIPTPNSGGVTTGDLPDAPDISFKKDDPAGTLRLTTKGPDGSDVIVVAQNQRGLYVNVTTGSALGRNLEGQLYLDLDAVHDAIDDASPQSARGEPDRRPKAATDDPNSVPRRRRTRGTDRAKGPWITKTTSTPA